MRGRYWDETLETLSARDTRRLEEERLREQIAYDYQTSAFYRSRLDEAGVAPDSIRHVEDLATIPFMEKTEIAESQADGTLLGINQCAALDQIVRIQATGGTTGRPMRIGLTRRDIADYGEIGARALWAMGCRPGDIVFECMNYNLYAGGLSDHLTFETVGAATMPFGVGHSERLLTMMSELRDPVCIWATPSYAVRLAEVAAGISASILDRSACARDSSQAKPASRSPDIASGSRTRGAWSPATSTGPASWGCIRASASTSRASTSAAPASDRRAGRPRHRRCAAVHRTASRGRSSTRRSIARPPRFSGCGPTT